MTILLLPFAVFNEGDEVSAKLARQLPRMLGSEIERSCASYDIAAKFLSARGSAQDGRPGLFSTIVLPELETLLQTGEMYGADLIIAGQLGLGDRELRLDMRIASRKKKAMVYAKHFETFPSYIFDALEEIKLRTTQLLGLALGEEERVVLFQRATESWQALLFFLLAEDERYGLTIGIQPGDLLQPLELYRESLLVDPDFAEARSGLEHYLLMLLELPDFAVPRLNLVVKQYGDYLSEPIKELLREVVGLE